MKLLHLKAHNVFSIGDVELSLKDRGLTLVTGWSYDDNNGNMAGKSSVSRNAIVWGMYGKTVDGVKADSVINTSIPQAKHCGVTLKFEGVDGKTYRIYRSRKPNELVLSRLKQPDPEEWEDLSKRLDRDTQELIDKLLGRDHKTFIQADYFGQGRERSFLSLPGSEQRAVIEEILPLNSLEAWRVNAKEKLAEANAKVDNAKMQAQLSSERVDTIRNKVEYVKAQQKKWESEKAEKAAELTARLEEARDVSDGLENELRALSQAIPDGMPPEEFLGQEEKFVNTLASMSNSAQYQIDALTNDIDNRSSRPDYCISCGQSLPDDAIAINWSEIEAMKERRNALLKEKGENEARLYNARANVGIAREALALERKLKEKGEQLSLALRLEDLNSAQNPFDITVNSWLEELRKEARINKAHYDLIEAEAKVRDHYHFWHHAFGTDLKTLLFEKVCPFLEDRANQYLADLNNSQIKVRFSTTKHMKSGDTKDQFCVTASTSTGSDTFELFSGAEKQLTSFAVGMALSDLAALQVEGASKFMILDEPFLYQSPENCENIINFIRTHKMGDDSTILLVSNEHNLASLIPNRIHVVKRNGVSSIE